jgi:hypothetical protein
MASHAFEQPASDLEVIADQAECGALFQVRQGPTLPRKFSGALRRGPGCVLQCAVTEAVSTLVIPTPFT